MADNLYIKKIKLDNNQVYYVYDVNAPRIEDLNNYLPITGGNITGDLEVDGQLKAGSLNVTSIEYMSSADPDSVLVQAADGSIQKRSVNNLLEDIGGASYSYDATTETLSFKIGKQ